MTARLEEARTAAKQTWVRLFRETRRAALSTAQRPRIAEIRDNLIARISEAEHQG